MADDTSLPAGRGAPTISDPVDPADLTRLLDAIVAVGSSSDLPTLLRRIIETATGLVGARFGALGVLDDSGTHLAEFLTTGVSDAAAAVIGDRPTGKGILGTLIVDPRPIRIDDLTDHPDSSGFPAGHPPMGSFLGVPIHARDQVFGNLYLCDKVHGGGFTARDEALIVALATTAGVAIESARLQDRLGEVRVLEDRERIARDLHDTVIQRMFASGLSLQGLVARETDPDVANRLQQVIDDLDETVRHIRTTIFELQRPRIPGRSTRQEIIDIVEELVEPAGIVTEVRFEGPLDLSVPDGIADHLEAAVREAVTNAVRHSGCTLVRIDIAVADEVKARIVDDGRGIDEARPEGHGLHNLRSRAEDLGGECVISRTPSGGTAVEWRVPLQPGT